MCCWENCEVTSAASYLHACILFLKFAVRYKHIPKGKERRENCEDIMFSSSPNFSGSFYSRSSDLCKTSSGFITHRNSV